MEFMTISTSASFNVLGALTPLQRWDAVTKHHSNPAANQLFIVIGLGTVGMLLMLLLFSRYRHSKDTQSPSAKLFNKHAEAKDLTEQEYTILMNMAINADLKRYESIFTLPSTFDRECAKILDDAQNQNKLEQFHQLKTELTLLRAKIGFPQYPSARTASATDTSTPSTKDVPIKKKIYVKTNCRERNDEIEAVVIANDSAGLTVQFRRSLEIVFGQLWTCRYYSGAFVAEFDTTAIRCNGHTVILSHSHQIRLVNRRKFLRVPVSKPAYIAHFPFRKESATEQIRSRKKIVCLENAAPTISAVFEPPQFVPATVIELGGPGLRIHTNLSLKTGDRVLLMFKLGHDSYTIDSDSLASSQKVIEHIAIVRHIATDASGPFAAIEFTGLNDDDINELICATNETLIRMNQWQNNLNDSDVHANQTRERVAI